MKNTLKNIQFHVVTFEPVSGRPRQTAVDTRLTIVVTDGERNQILYEMRALLHGLFNLHSALARNDMNAVAVAAKPLGPVLSRIPKGMRDRLPQPFMEMSIGQNEIFDTIARDALSVGDMKHTQGQMAEAMTYCSGCHDTYRFQVGQLDPK